MRLHAAKDEIKLSNNVSLRRTVIRTDKRKSRMRNGGCERAVGEIGARRSQDGVKSK